MRSPAARRAASRSSDCAASTSDSARAGLAAVIQHLDAGNPLVAQIVAEPVAVAMVDDDRRIEEQPLPRRAARARRTPRPRCRAARPRGTARRVRTPSGRRSGSPSAVVVTAPLRPARPESNRTSCNSHRRVRTPSRGFRRPRHRRCAARRCAVAVQPHPAAIDDAVAVDEEQQRAAGLAGSPALRARAGPTLEGSRSRRDARRSGRSVSAICRRAIGRGVVDDDHLEVAAVLIEHRGETRAQGRFTVEDGDDDAGVDRQANSLRQAEGGRW